MHSFEEIKRRALQGHGASVDEALWLADNVDTDTLCDAADEIRRANCGDRIDTCAIANARSGRCSEDCKWCAQSRHFSTGIEEYDCIPTADAVTHGKAAADAGVRRYSLVTSGRRVAAEHIGRFCEIYREISRNTPGLYLCASMGLLGRAELRKLREAGVRRYHCNLETGADYFPRLCSTHTQTDKLATIRMAREEGLEICCGGIIGMGETLRDRLMLACQAREAGAVSIPVNILTPIPGTALADTPLLSEDEIILTAALFRFIAPALTIRFAGGRARLSEACMRRTLRGGMNGAMIGDLLTTSGSRAESDRRLFAELGFTL